MNQLPVLSNMLSAFSDYVSFTWWQAVLLLLLIGLIVLFFVIRKKQ